MNTLISRLFSKEDVNTGRQFEFDYTKALCIFTMVVMHAYIELSPEAMLTEGTISNFVAITLCTIFGASTFMVCMGMGFTYSKNKDNPNFFINRGIKIFILSYVLNFVRSFIDTFFLSPRIYGTLFNNALLSNLFNVDIMQFAGVAMILFGLLLKLKLKPIHIFLIGIVLSICSMICPYFSTGNSLADLLIGVFLPNKYLDGEEIFSCFPLISYFIYPAFGYLYGNFDRKIKDKKTYYAIVSPICGVIAITYAVISVKYGLPNTTDLGYYHPYTWDCLINIISSIFLFGVFYYFSLIAPKFIERFAVFTSSNINTVYCIHWVFVLNIQAILAIRAGNVYLSYDENIISILGISIYIISVLITYFYSGYKKKKKA